MKKGAERVDTRDVVYSAAKRVPLSAIPVIDIGPLFTADRQARAEVIKAIDHACLNIGFFYIANHGVSEALIDRVYAQSKRFFALPKAEKMKVHFKNVDRFGRGYVAMGDAQSDAEVQADVHETFEIMLETPADDPDYLAGVKMYGPNQWPQTFPGFREDVYAYYEAILGLSRTLYRAFALALGLPEAFFEGKIEKPMTQLLCMHYPPDPRPDDEECWGVAPHSDYECFTILKQNVPGLEVVNSAGEWILAPPIPGTFVVNIGDLLARWTNDVYASTIHRVKNLSGDDRYSFSCFCSVNHDTAIRCLDNCHDEANPPKYPPIQAVEWSVKMLERTYNYKNQSDSR
jgi:isopenicillin N synthase-like dioxygenase